MNITEYMARLEPENVTFEGATFIVGQEGLFNKMLKAKWVKPVVQRNKCVLFSVNDVRVACARLKNGEYPEAIQLTR